MLILIKKWLFRVKVNGTSLCFLLSLFMFHGLVKPASEALNNLSIVMSTGTKPIGLNLTLTDQLVCLFKNLLVNQLYRFKLGEANVLESNALFLNCLPFCPLSHLQSNSCSLVYCFTSHIQHEKTPSRYPLHHNCLLRSIVVVFITVANCVFN